MSQSFFKKIAHTLKRHPLLFFIRYVVVSKNNKNQNIDAVGCFNDSNAIDSVPALYFEINSKIPIDPTQNELERALAIGTFLRNTIKGGTGIGLSSGKTLEKMIAGKGGVCSDFSQIFNIFCLINNIRVKEWGCIDSFYKTKFGHSFNEIYVEKYQKWIAIDIHKGIIFNDPAHNNYFSTIELFNDLRKGNLLQFTHYSGYNSPRKERIPLVYAATTIPFIIDNSKNRAVDHYYNKFQNKLPLLMINALLILMRKNQTFIFVIDDYIEKLLPRPFQKLRRSS